MSGSHVPPNLLSGALTMAKTATTTAKTTKSTKATANGKPAGTPGRAKKEGLRSAQVRILQYLSKAKSAQPRKTIAEKAPCDLANCTELLGSHDDAKRISNDDKYFPSLVTLGAVKVQVTEDEGVTYVITGKGNQLLTAALKTA